MCGVITLVSRWPPFTALLFQQTKPAEVSKIRPESDRSPAEIRGGWAMVHCKPARSIGSLAA